MLTVDFDLYIDIRRLLVHIKLYERFYWKSNQVIKFICKFE